MILFIPILYYVGKKIVLKKEKEQLSFFIKNNQNKPQTKNIWYIKLLLIITGIIFMIFSIWRPQWGNELQKTEKKGLDIVFTVDVSKSMKALDFSQRNQLISRLDATKYLIEDFIKTQKSNRLGLVEFAGESFVASPLTLDHTVFLNFLKNISSDDLGKQGTNLAEAIEISIARLEIQSNKKRGKAIILFSDGDETISSDAKKMANLAKEKGIKIFTIGIGSEEGMPIPENQDVWGSIIYKKWKGKTVLTSLNPDPLKEIGNITNAEYLHAENINDLNNLIIELKKLPKKILKEKNINPQSEQYFIFTFLGLIFFSFGFLLPTFPYFKK